MIVECSGVKMVVSKDKVCTCVLCSNVQLNYQTADEGSSFYSR